MNNSVLPSILATLVFVSACSAQEVSADENGLSVTRYAAQNTTVAPTENFTGTAKVSSRFSSGRDNGYGGAIVEFEPGARTNWHTHPMGQTLIVISGTGRVQSDGEPSEVVQPGDVVWIPPGERHWHGASPDSPMSHVAIAEPLDGVRVEWMEAVSEDEYLGR
ncbi:cupin domain-containing protein [Parvularcula flava]|uniref:Cupin domain-containing protein n=1 Tax=Aquisalinus luteolus TaxID=1566827 RepID=A0A8J3A5A4_9PROT|nr:cupin domain-containing protein [Aquisalinus luteolus]NHK27181.1 cupin domain-containing protein [Aquisalinus luteolus]GGH94654.1 germin subfamily 1 member 15 [Aquisalinus luteolus]